MTKLQVLIVAYGRKGIESVARLPHPPVEGVEYIVSWQFADDPPVVPEVLSQRKDFRVLPTPTRGVSVNRNLTLDAASAPIVLESDDDVYYSEDQLKAVIRAFDDHPEADYIHFRYHSDDYPVDRPDKEFNLRRPPRGWYPGGIEMAFRLDPIRKHGIRFNELFGVGCEFPSGEEDIFVSDVLKAGLNAIYLPVTIVTHPGNSTCMREGESETFIRTKGAMFPIIHPFSWPLRMITHARRFSPSWRERCRYIRAWLCGVRDIRRIKSNRHTS